jgi:hypothetical protein
MYYYMTEIKCFKIGKILFFWSPDELIGKGGIFSFQNCNTVYQKTSPLEYKQMS